MTPRSIIAALLVVCLVAGCLGQKGEPGVLRIGHFANITHGQALYGVQGGLFARAMGATELETQVFVAGPAAFEALLAGQVDIIYAGPTPTAFALAATGSDVIRVIAGSASGGVLFVVAQALEGAPSDELRGRRFATPQLGNTQDVALKTWLHERGMSSRAEGGDVDVVNTAPSEILLLFQRGQIDGAWVPEPWATRMLHAGGVVYVDERDLWEGGQFITTHVITRTAFLDAREPEVRAFLAAHVEATETLAGDTRTAAMLINDAIRAETGQTLDMTVVSEAVARVSFTYDPFPSAFMRGAQDARELGFIEKPLPDPKDFYDLRILNEILAEKGAPEVERP